MDIYSSDEIAGRVHGRAVSCQCPDSDVDISIQPMAGHYLSVREWVRLTIELDLGRHVLAKGFGLAVVEYKGCSKTSGNPLDSRHPAACFGKMQISRAGLENRPAQNGG